MQTRPNALGEYLRARRELVDPGTAGVPVSGVRRTPGLRREEVAALAGISANYYLRLEQGRDRNPSVQVLEALARALFLDADASLYLMSISSERPVRRRRPRREVVPVPVLQLLAALDLPAFVESRAFEVLATNRLATALSPCITPGENRLRSMFLDERERDLHPDWQRSAAGMVAAFRISIGNDYDDPRIAHLVGEISLADESFRRLWARHDVRALAGSAAPIRHPAVGLMKLTRSKLTVSDAVGQILVVYHAEPGTEGAESLSLLGSLTATDPASAGVVEVANEDAR